VEERKIAAAAVLFLHTGGEGGGGEEEGRRVEDLFRRAYVPEGDSHLSLYDTVLSMCQQDTGLA